MIIGNDMTGSPRLKVDVQEYKGDQSTGNSRNRTYSIYDETNFWKIFNLLGEELFPNFEITIGKERNHSGKRVRVKLQEAIGNQLNGKSRSFSVWGTSVTKVRSEIEKRLLEEYEDKE